MPIIIIIILLTFKPPLDVTETPFGYPICIAPRGATYGSDTNGKCVFKAIGVRLLTVGFQILHYPTPLFM
jgi:hypothetical protein